MYSLLHLQQCLYLEARVVRQADPGRRAEVESVTGLPEGDHEAEVAGPPHEGADEGALLVCDGDVEVDWGQHDSSSNLLYAVLNAR